MSWRNRSKNAPISIHRSSEKEILSAIAQLELRGFECSYGPKLVTENGQRLGRYVKDKKKCLLETTSNQQWIAQMRRKQDA